MFRASNKPLLPERTTAKRFLSIVLAPARRRVCAFGRKRSCVTNTILCVCVQSRVTYDGCMCAGLLVWRWVRACVQKIEQPQPIPHMHEKHHTHTHKESRTTRTHPLPVSARRGSGAFSSFFFRWLDWWTRPPSSWAGWRPAVGHRCQHRWLPSSSLATAMGVEEWSLARGRLRWDWPAGKPGNWKHSATGRGSKGT